MEGRETLEQALKEIGGKLCLVSHDVAFVRALANSVIDISPRGVRRFPGTYDEYRDWLQREERREAQDDPSAEAADETEQTTATAPADSAAATMNRRERCARAQIRERLMPRIAPLRRLRRTRRAAHRRTRGRGTAGSATWPPASREPTTPLLAAARHPARAAQDSARLGTRRHGARGT